MVRWLDRIKWDLWGLKKWSKKKNIKIKCFRFLNLIMISRKFGYNKDKITEKDLNYIDKKYL